MTGGASRCVCSCLDCRCFRARTLSMVGYAKNSILVALIATRFMSKDVLVPPLSNHGGLFFDPPAASPFASALTSFS